jgi:ABC-type glucose/galactose transport system permease subunit
VSVVRAEEWSGIRLVVVLGITPSIVTINANHKEKRQVAEVSVVSAALMVQAV